MTNEFHQTTTVPIDGNRNRVATTLDNNNIQNFVPPNNSNSRYASPPITCFEINVSKETFKFNAAHFVAYRGFRERLHGHNYQVSLRLMGSRTISHDGYVLDFGDAKKVVKDVCSELNEFFICPMLSDVIEISILEGGGKGGKVSPGDDDDDDDALQQDTVKLVCEDGAMFLFPKQDCAMLPIVHATVEELAIYLWGKILSRLDVRLLRKRGIHTMEVKCSEAPGQEALFRMEIPQPHNSSEGDEYDMDAEIAKRSNVRSYISSGDLFPRPCLPKPTDSANLDFAPRVSSSNNRDVLQEAVTIAKNASERLSHSGCNNNCSCRENFVKQLQGLIDAMKDNRLAETGAQDSP